MKRFQRLAMQANRSSRQEQLLLLKAKNVLVNENVTCGISQHLEVGSIYNHSLTSRVSTVWIVHSVQKDHHNKKTDAAALYPQMLPHRMRRLKLAI